MEVLKSYIPMLRVKPKPKVLKNWFGAPLQLLRCSPRIKIAGYQSKRLDVRSVEAPAKINTWIESSLRVGHCAIFISCVQLEVRSLTTGSSRSLRSLWTSKSYAFGRPLTKR